jgi:chromate transporter
MNDGSLTRIALTFATLSLFSVGGAPAIIPEIHRQVVDVLGWMTDAGFSNAFAISQAAPGPNMMIISLIGWRVAGIAGLVVATLAAIAPPSILALGAGRLFARMGEEPWFPKVKAGLAPVVVGLYLASGLVTARVADSNLTLVAITLAVTAFVVATRRNPLWALMGGAAAAVGAAILGFL